MVQRVKEETIGLVARHPSLALALSPLPFGFTGAYLLGLGKDLKMGDKARQNLQQMLRRRAVEEFTRVQGPAAPGGFGAGAESGRTRALLTAVRQRFAAPATAAGPARGYPARGYLGAVIQQSLTGARPPAVSPFVRMRLKELRHTMLAAKRR